MPATYRRLIIGLLIFLGLMLLVGRFPGRIDTPAPTATGEASLPIEARLTARKARPAPAALRDTPDCPRAAREQALPLLQRYHDDFIQAVAFSHGEDAYSLSGLLDQREQLAALPLPACLYPVRQHLLDAADTARNILRNALGQNMDVFTLHERMHAAMRPALQAAQTDMQRYRAPAEQP